MQLRQFTGDSLIGFTCEGDTNEALVTDNPHLFDPTFTLGRIVVMPERALVNLIASQQLATTQMRVVDSLASNLLEEVQEECGNGCKASTDTFTGDVPEIGVIVVSAGVVCENANNCGSCPAGVRKEL